MAEYTEGGESWTTKLVCPLGALGSDEPVGMRIVWVLVLGGVVLFFGGDALTTKCVGQMCLTLV